MGILILHHGILDSASDRCTLAVNNNDPCNIWPLADALEGFLDFRHARRPLKRGGLQIVSKEIEMCVVTFLYKAIKKKKEGKEDEK